MLVSVQEMEMICIFYNSTKAETVGLMRHAAGSEKDEGRATGLRALADKLEAAGGATVCLAFG